MYAYARRVSCKHTVPARRLQDVPDDGSPLQVSLPLCSEHIDTTSEQSKAPKVPGAAAEGGVCRLNMTLQWIPSAQARAVPALRTPGCIQVYVKTVGGWWVMAWAWSQGTGQGAG